MIRMMSLAPPSPSSPPPPSSRPLSETRTRRPPMPPSSSPPPPPPPRAVTGAAERYLVDREFPSDEDCYSSDYESYHESDDDDDDDDDDWSEGAKEEGEEEPDEKSHQIRPPTSVQRRERSRSARSRSARKGSSGRSKSAARRRRGRRRSTREEEEEDEEGDRRRSGEEEGRRSGISDGLALDPSALNLQLESPHDLEGPDPVVTVCPGCRSQVVTRVERRASEYSWLACIICICIVPCTWETLKDNAHLCPNCGLDLTKLARAGKDGTENGNNNDGDKSSGQNFSSSGVHLWRPTKDTSANVRSVAATGATATTAMGQSVRFTYYTLPSPKSSSGRRLSKETKIRTCKVSPIQQELERLKIPTKLQQQQELHL